MTLKSSSHYDHVRLPGPSWLLQVHVLVPGAVLERYVVYHDNVLMVLFIVTTVGGAIACLFYPGASWFFHELVPPSLQVPSPASYNVLDSRSFMAVLQMGNCEQLYLFDTI